jgi:hypothetical protein
LKRKLNYISKGRGGQVIYSDSISEIQLEYEFGGGNCIAYIFIPSIQNWEKETKRPLSEREEILLFIAGQSTHDQVSGGYFKITDNFIELYKD